MTFGDIVEEELQVADGQELENALLVSLQLLEVVKDKEMSLLHLELADQTQNPHTDLGPGPYNLHMLNVWTSDNSISNFCQELRGALLHNFVINIVPGLTFLTITFCPIRNLAR